MKLSWISYLNLFSDILPICAGIYQWKRVREGKGGTRYMFSFVTIGVVSEYISFWMASHGIHNLWVLHLYHLFEYVLLMFFFISLMKSNNFPRLIIRILELSIPCYVIFWLVSKWTFEKWDDQAGYTHNWTTMIFIALSLFVLYRFMKDSDTTDIRVNYSVFDQYGFWFAGGVLLYFSGSVVLFLLLPLIATVPGESTKSLYAIHWGVNVVTNIVYAYGLLCLKKSPQAE